MQSRITPVATGLAVVGCGLGLLVSFAAENGQPNFTGIQPLTNKEVALSLHGSNGVIHRIETSRNLSNWSGLITMPGASSSLQHTDSAAPYLGQRFYRAAQLSGTNILTGDHLVTDDGEVVIQPLRHATFVMGWKGKMIYNDPDDPANYQGLAKADLILVGHDHGDHFSGPTIDAVRGPNAVLVVPPYIYANNLSAAQRAIAIALTNGVSTNLLGLTIEAVPAYNGNHPRGRGNGYVLTIGGRRLYISGDTGDVAEMRALPNIDVAFLAMNLPFTMAVTNAASAARAFRPKVVYPYHYSPSTPPSDPAVFKQLVGTDLGIEVRLRKWY